MCQIYVQPCKTNRSRTTFFSLPGPSYTGAWREYSVARRVKFCSPAVSRTTWGLDDWDIDDLTSGVIDGWISWWNIMMVGISGFHSLIIHDFQWLIIATLTTSIHSGNFGRAEVTSLEFIWTFLNVISLPECYQRNLKNVISFSTFFKW